MLDLDLLKSFVSVVDAGGFTRAGERVHRTQSTISQQIRKLEETVGKTLMMRDARKVELTEEGRKLAFYARRLLALEAEAREAVATPRTEVVRLGIPEDLAIGALTDSVSAFARAHPHCRLEVRCGLSVELAAGAERGEFDVVLTKREPVGAPALAVWPERLVWIASAHYPLQTTGVLPLVVFPQGCVYRARMIHALEAMGRDWRIAYESPNLLGIQAAISGGLGIALLEQRTLSPGHRILGQEAGLPEVAPAELALNVAPGAPPLARGLADILMEFCSQSARKAA